MKRNKTAVVILNTLCGIFITLGFLALGAALWFSNNFNTSVGFDAVLFTLFSELNGVNPWIIANFIFLFLLPTLLLSAGFTVFLINLPKLLDREHGEPSLSKRTCSLIIAFAMFVLTSGIGITSVHLDDYILSRLTVTSLFEDEYVDPADVEIRFPQEKRNLIYIYLESMETTFLSEQDGGALSVNLIPELATLAKENLNFSQTEGLGGARTTPGSTWTIAAMISHTAGIPLRLPNGIWENGYNYYSKVLPGVTSLTDILKENGYYQALMVGSDASFGGRREYFTQHGADQIYDLFTAREEGAIPPGYHNGFWGFEDEYLFEYAREKLTEIAAGDQPFAFTMLTVDTHHPEGYRCDFCEEEHSQQFENVLSCSSRQVLAFVQWIQRQEFYENTTVIITGDHYSMNQAYMDRSVPDRYVRRTYNCFINVPVQTEHHKNREFTTLDMFPTTLAAMGCTIPGDRLGLGTNLFSRVQTLSERYGFDALSAEIEKTSPFYESKFLYGTKED